MFRCITVVCLLQSVYSIDPTSTFEYEYHVLAKLVELDQFKAETAMKVAALENQLQSCTANSQKHTSATYVHWGMRTCPNVTGTTQVYTGQAAGGHYTHPGSGEYICLPSDPEYDQYNDVSDPTRSLMYGAEYETQSNPAFSNLHQNDVPCAVCLARGKTTLMIPGRTTCYSGWSKEYQGYLMGELHSHHGKGYVCMDKYAEPLHSSVADLNGALFYMVEGRCGTLQCSPYVEGREIACVVCSFRS